MKIRLLFLSTVVNFLFFSCGPSEDDAEFTSEIAFNVKAITASGGRVSSTDLENAKSILVTIKKMDGTPTDYTLYQLPIFNAGGEYVSENLILPTGAYEVTEFFVLSQEGKIILIAPLEGSEQAQNVSESLPIQFLITKDQITFTTIEVISNEGFTLADFGLAGFSLTEIELFHFLAFVSEQGMVNALLEAEIIVTSEDYQFKKQLLGITNNTILIKDGYSDYEVTVNKEGYESFNHTFIRDSLSAHASAPLNIELIEILDSYISPIIDARDGKMYETVLIGDQRWMAENLRATVYNDGSAIEFPRTDITAWEDNTTGAYALYDFDEIVYGMLYNWYAVKTGKLCPDGWHMPSDEEWLTLSTFLGGSSIAGGKMKVTGTGDWDDPNLATNSTGFSAYPAGWAYFAYGHFSYKGNLAAFWSSDEGINADHGISRQIDNNSTNLERNTSSNSSNKGNGFSCRCLED